MSAQPQLFATESTAYLQQQIITYIGNKRSLLPLIQEALHVISERTGKDRLSTLDLFSGSGIVARFLKKDEKLLGWINIGTEKERETSERRPYDAAKKTFYLA